jgi:transposase
MGKPTSSENFKRNAVWGSPVGEVSERLGVSTHSLYKWIKMYAQTLSVDHEAENRRLKRALARMTEERDILREVAAYFAKDAR